MEYRHYERTGLSEIESLFISTFTKSENEKEGILIGKLVRELITDTDRKDLFGFVAIDKELTIGSIFFSRLTFEDDTDIFILSPVAIDTEYQGGGIGQELIKYGLEQIKKEGVSIVTTYGDPNFYVKVGFLPLSIKIINPPFELSQPEGWLGQSLTGDSIKTKTSTCSCVKALSDPVYW